jgi:hypothetical protein
MFDLMRPQLSTALKINYAADPALDVLLDKSRLAQIRIRQLDQMIAQLQQEVELAKMEQTMLKEEYKLK